MRLGHYVLLPTICCSSCLGGSLLLRGQTNDPRILIDDPNGWVPPSPTQAVFEVRFSFADLQDHSSWEVLSARTSWDAPGFAPTWDFGQASTQYPAFMSFFPSSSGFDLVLRDDGGGGLLSELVVAVPLLPAFGPAPTVGSSYLIPLAAGSQYLDGGIGIGWYGSFSEGELAVVPAPLAAATGIAALAGLVAYRRRSGAHFGI